MDLNYTQKIKDLIDNLKARCNGAGLGGDGNEYKVITQSFLYKFLNDKFLHDVVKVKPELADSSNLTESLSKLNEDEYGLMLARLGGNTAKLKPEHLISTLFNRQNESDFYKLFNDTLHDIAVMNTSTFSVHTDEGTDVLLFDNELFNSVSDSSKRNSLARAVINLLANEKLDFSMAFDQGFDFFSTIFEYMIKDYNANGGGVYAEYYTPRSVARIMADILIGDDKPTNVKILDPSAGSGTLLMSIAHKIGSDNCSIYSQDISQKSSNLLRLNLILNNLAHSISHVVEGNTITHPAHMDILKKDSGFDCIVSNPPFNLDFSGYRNEVANNPAYTNRFFAGVPSIPKKKKESMPIYTLFLQHILHMLNKDGNAAIVVPSGFLTDTNTIQTEIRKKLVNDRILKAVIQMPTNVFANTNTSVSIIFVSKQNNNGVMFVDASHLGRQEKNGDATRTILSGNDQRTIVNSIIEKTNEPEFSILKRYDEIIENEYMLKPGLFFGIKLETLSKYKNDLSISKSTYYQKLQGLRSEYISSYSRNKLIELFIESNNSDVEYVTLDSLIDKTIGGDWGKEKPDNTSSIKIRCIRGADIPDVNLHIYSAIPTRYCKAKAISSKKLEEGDMVIEISGGSPIQSTGRICLITADILTDLKLPVLCTNFCRILRLKNKKYTTFVYEYLSLLYDRGYFFNLENNTTGIKNLLVAPFLNNVLVPIPKNEKAIDDYYADINECMSKFDKKLKSPYNNQSY